MDSADNIEMRPSCCSPLNNNSIFINLDAENLTPFQEAENPKLNDIELTNYQHTKKKRRRNNTL